MFEWTSFSVKLLAINPISKANNGHAGIASSSITPGGAAPCVRILPSIFYIPPRLNDLKNEGGLFYIEGGGVTLVKRWTRLYSFLQLSETNSDPAFRAKDLGLNGGYGYSGV